MPLALYKPTSSLAPGLSRPALKEGGWGVSPFLWAFFLEGGLIHETPLEIP